MDPADTPPAPPPHAQIMRMMSGAWIAQTLYAAARLDIARRLAAGPRTAADLAGACGVLPDRLERMLRALASEGVFHRLDDGRFENTPVSAVLASDAPGNVNAGVRMLGEEQYTAWSRFHDCLTQPKTAFELWSGEPIFTWYARHPRQLATFNQAMADYSSMQVPAIVAAYDPSAARTIVDVGGGHGGLLVGLLGRAPHAKGIVFDLPQGLEAARAAGLGSNSLVAGDFFDSVPAGADLYVMKFILHDWDDERCVTILRHIRTGMAPGGKVLVCDQIVGPENQPDPAKWMDLHMMTMPGGLERTQAQFVELFRRAGLRLTRVIQTESEMSLLEAERETR